MARQKPFFQRAWLNPPSQRDTSSISAQVSDSDAAFTIRDCYKEITVHSSYMDNDSSYANERNRFLAKIELIESILSKLKEEVWKRWP